MRRAALPLVLLALAPLAAGAASTSRSLGFPWDGRLVGGVELSAAGPHFFTWDPIRKRRPNRPWRRYGNRRLVSTLLRVIGAFAAAHPGAPRIGVGDLSRPRGGDFGPQYGGLGHASHQNGLDADVYYPRRDGRERSAARPAQIDRRLAQDLLDRFVAAGAEKIFVGPHTRLHGPPGIVEVLGNHDDHMHVRLAGDGARPWLVGPIRAFALGHGRPYVLAVGCAGRVECSGGAVVSRAIQSPPPQRGTLWLVPALSAGSWDQGLALLSERLRPDRVVRFRRPGARVTAGAVALDLPAGLVSVRYAGPYVAELRRLAE